jgi:hypothetical protein
MLHCDICIDGIGVRVVWMGTMSGMDECLFLKKETSMGSSHSMGTRSTNRCPPMPNRSLINRPNVLLAMG